MLKINWERVKLALVRKGAGLKKEFCDGQESSFEQLIQQSWIFFN